MELRNYIRVDDLHLHFYNKAKWNWEMAAIQKGTSYATKRQKARYESAANAWADMAQTDIILSSIAKHSGYSPQDMTDLQQECYRNNTQTAEN